jgi:hypothetical protein
MCQPVIPPTVPLAEPHWRVSVLGTRMNNERTSPRQSQRQDETNDESGKGENHGPDCQQAERRCGERSIYVGHQSGPPTKLHSDDPDGGTNRDEGQCHHRLVAREGPQSPKRDGYGDRNREPGSAPCELGAFSGEAGDLRVLCCITFFVLQMRRALLGSDEGEHDGDDRHDPDADGKHQWHRRPRQRLTVPHRPLVGLPVAETCERDQCTERDHW